MTSFDIMSAPLKDRLFIQASAGTGKTFTLVQLVVRILLETSIPLDRIAVITFAQAASRELRSRIRIALEEKINLADPLARKRGFEAIAHFGQAQVSTIHGWCQSLLREFAFEAGLQPDFRICTEEEERSVIRDFLRHGEHLTPMQWKRLLGGHRQNIEVIVEKMLRAKLLSPPFDLLGSFQNEIEQMKPFPVAQEFSAIREHYKGMTSPRFQLQADWIEQILYERKVDFHRLDSLIGEKELFLEKLVPQNRKVRAPFSIESPLFHLGKRLLPILDRGRLLEKILETAQSHWRQYRKQVIPQMALDEIIPSFHEALKKSRFCNSVRSKYEVLIVDEFQDTDLEQWKVLKKLFLHEEGKRVYLVGDPKQSIYGFRNADIYTFFEAAQNFKDDEKVVLDTNYRSTQGLVEQINTLFSQRPWLTLPKWKQSMPVLPVNAAKTGKGNLYFMTVQGTIGRGSRWPTEDMENSYLFPFMVHELRKTGERLSNIGILVKDRYQAARVRQFLTSWNIPCVSDTESSFLPEWVAEFVDACQGGGVRKLLVNPLVGLSLDEITDDTVIRAKKVLEYLSSVWKERGFKACLAAFLRSSFYDRLVIERLDMHRYHELVAVIESIPLLAEPHEIYGVLERLKTTGLRGVVEPLEAVQVMTVHGSKGLEFEVVFALGVSTRTGKVETITEEGQAEKLRQLYVAVTRAKSQLYIPLLIETTGKPSNPNGLSSMEAFLEAANPDLSLFSHFDLNQFQFDLGSDPNHFTIKEKKGCEIRPLCISSPILEPSPLSIHSFSSLFKGDYKRDKIEQSSFPDGLETGLIIHHILERFFNREKELFQLVLEETAFTSLEPHQHELTALLDRALDLDLGGFCLRQVEHALPEVEFLFKTSETSYIAGWIDLCIEYGNSYYLVDWKTHLLPDYSVKTLNEVMIKNHYLAQGRIYAAAFQKYLNLHHKEMVFKGCFFFFLRGGTVYSVTEKQLDSEMILSRTGNS